MGRPPVENPASTVLGTVRLTPVQRANYVKAAKACSEPLSAWVKINLDRAAQRDLKN